MQETKSEEKEHKRDENSNKSYVFFNDQTSEDEEELVE